MDMPRNPYIAGTPVGNTHGFVGREEILREVMRALRSNGSIVLYGQRRIGKTSILQYLKKYLSKTTSYKPIYYDLQDKADWSLPQVLVDLSEIVANDLNITVPDLGDNPKGYFREKWLPEAINFQTDRTIVLLFDEFDILADPKRGQAAKDFFPYLRQLMALDPKKLGFIFILGRNMTELSSAALSVFKGTPSKRISLLPKIETENLINLSVKNGTLTWPPDTIEKIWSYTHGHPFLTQALCARIWDDLHEMDEDSITFPVTISNIEKAVPDTLETSKNMLEWLWDGLSPAQRIVAAAMAQAGPIPVDEDGLNRILTEGGIRIVIRELQDAPKLLQDWDILEETTTGYAFRVELFRKWVVENKSLKRVQDELDRINPLAESLYQSGNMYFEGNNLKRAEDQLRDALSVNPNHLRANELLATILITNEKLLEAKELLERLLEYAPQVARPRLIQVYLKLAPSDENEKLLLLEKILSLSPNNEEAKNGIRTIWINRRDAALNNGNLEAALMAFQALQDEENIEKIKAEIIKQKFNAAIKLVLNQEAEKHYKEALSRAEDLSHLYPQALDWEPLLNRLRQKNNLSDMYQRALGALTQRDKKAATKLLVDVISLEPDYEEATRYLHLAVTGEDVNKLKQKIIELVKQISSYEDKERKKQLSSLVDKDTNPPKELSALISGPGTSESEQDDALLWLESLAQKQGAKPEELITNPEERTKSAPDWVGKVGEVPDKVVQPELLSDLISGPGTSESEQDEALLWLESLVQKQGAKPEELITNLEEPKLKKRESKH